MPTLTVQPSRRLTVLVCLTAVFAGAPPLRSQAAADSADLPPPGFGTLHQDDIAVRIALPNLQLRVLPLDERIIRLLAPDAYASLSRLPRTRAAEIERASLEHNVRRPMLFLVTFFGLEPGARFNPEEVGITSQNRFFRPVALVPISTQWSELELKQRETAHAIYLFEEGIALLAPMTVSYRDVSSTQWEQSLRRLELERARVHSRGAVTPRPGEP